MLNQFQSYLSYIPCIVYSRVMPSDKLEATPLKHVSHSEFARFSIYYAFVVNPFALHVECFAVVFYCFLHLFDRWEDLLKIDPPLKVIRPEYILVLTLSFELIAIVVPAGNKDKLMLQNSFLMEELVELAHRLREGWISLAINHVFGNAAKLSAERSQLVHSWLNICMELCHHFFLFQVYYHDWKLNCLIEDERFFFLFSAIGLQVVDTEVLDWLLMHILSRVEVVNTPEELRRKVTFLALSRR